MQPVQRRLINHPNGQVTAYFYDSYIKPWQPAETILLQHGFGRTAEHLYHLVPVLVQRYNILRRDLRGHGSSSYPKPGQDNQYDYSVDTIVDEIKDTLDQLGIDKVHFIGESTSGMLAAIMAATYPERVSSVTICSSPTHLPLAAQQFLAFGMQSWPEACRQLGSRGWAERLAASNGTVSSSDPAFLSWWLDKIATSDGEGLAGYAEFLSKLDSRPYLARIQCPMLILAPTNSALVTLESMKEVAAIVPNASLRAITSRGHEIYVDEPEKCLASIKEFLAGIQV